jgi:hypothetical protein
VTGNCADDYRHHPVIHQVRNLVRDRLTRRAPVHVEGVGKDEPLFCPHIT